MTEQDGALHSDDSLSHNDAMVGVSGVEQEASSLSCVSFVIGSKTCVTLCYSTTVGLLYEVEGHRY